MGCAAPARSRRKPAEVLADGLATLLAGRTGHSPAQVSHALVYFLLPEIGQHAGVERFMAQHLMALGVTAEMTRQAAITHVEAVFERLPPEPELVQQIQDMALQLVHGERDSAVAKTRQAVSGPDTRTEIVSDAPALSLTELLGQRR